MVITSSTRNRVVLDGTRGFESLLLRQRKDSAYIAGSFLYEKEEGNQGSSERSGVASGLAAKRTPLSPQKSLLAWVSGRLPLLCPCCFIISQQMGTITHFYHCKNNICPTDCIRVVKPCLITCPQRFQLLVATYLSQD